MCPLNNSNVAKEMLEVSDVGDVDPHVSVNYSCRQNPNICRNLPQSLLYCTNLSSPGQLYPHEGLDSRACLTALKEFHACLRYAVPQKLYLKHMCLIISIVERVLESLRPHLMKKYSITMANSAPIAADES